MQRLTCARGATVIIICLVLAHGELANAGANGYRRLIEACGGQHRIVALVRSERALQQLSASL